LKLFRVSAEGQPPAGSWLKVYMYWVYVLRSLKSKKRYVGSTSKEPLMRLKEHNAGVTKSTSPHRPYDLVYREIFDNKTDALKREKFLKSGQGRKYLDQSIPP